MMTDGDKAPSPCVPLVLALERRSRAAFWKRGAKRYFSRHVRVSEMDALDQIIAEHLELYDLMKAESGEGLLC